MSNGMYCSASQEIDSASSLSVITGSVIFFTMTAFPDNEAQTSLPLKAAFWSNTRRIASDTAPASMMAPSTIASVGPGSEPNAAMRYPLPAGLSSTAFTALDPMSSPTTAFGLRNTDYSLFTIASGDPSNAEAFRVTELDRATAVPGTVDLVFSGISATERVRGWNFCDAAPSAADEKVTGSQIRKRRISPRRSAAACQDKRVRRNLHRH